MRQTGNEPQGAPVPAPAGGADGPSGTEFAGLGVQFVVSIVAGMYGGQWLDRTFGTTPWCLVGGVFLGAVLSFVSVFRRLRAAESREAAGRKVAP